MANLKNQNAGGKLNQSNVRKMGRGGGMRGGSRDPGPGQYCECNSNQECGNMYNSNWLCFYGNGQYGMQNSNDGFICQPQGNNYGICQEQQSSGYDTPTQPWSEGYGAGGRARPKPTAKRRTRPTAKRRSRPTMARGGRIRPTASRRTKPTMARGRRR